MGSTSIFMDRGLDMRACVEDSSDEQLMQAGEDKGQGRRSKNHAQASAQAQMELETTTHTVYSHENAGCQ